MLRRSRIELQIVLTMCKSAMLRTVSCGGMKMLDGLRGGWLALGNDAAKRGVENSFFSLHHEII